MNNHFDIPSLYYLYFSKVRKRGINRTFSSLSLSLSFSFFFNEEKRGHRTCFQRDLNFDKALATSQTRVETCQFLFLFFIFLFFFLISAQWFIDSCHGRRLKKAWERKNEKNEKGIFTTEFMKNLGGIWDIIAVYFIFRIGKNTWRIIRIEMWIPV